MVSSPNDSVNRVNEKVSSLDNSITIIHDKVEAHDNHVTIELMELDHNLQQNSTLQLENSLGYIYPVCTCGSRGGWRRVVYLKFTDPNTTCSAIQLSVFSDSLIIS